LSFLELTSIPHPRDERACLPKFHHPTVYLLFKELFHHNIKEISIILVNYSTKILKVSIIYKYLHSCLNFVKKRLQKWRLN
jgi:hypothetical protein